MILYLQTQTKHCIAIQQKFREHQMYGSYYDKYLLYLTLKVRAIFVSMKLRVCSHSDAVMSSFCAVMMQRLS